MNQQWQNDGVDEVVASPVSPYAYTDGDIGEFDDGVDNVVASNVSPYRWSDDNEMPSWLMVEKAAPANPTLSLSDLVVAAENAADQGEMYRKQSADAYETGDTDKAGSLSIMAMDAYKTAHEHLREAVALANGNR